jgi:hypothetical protein
MPPAIAPMTLPQPIVRISFDEIAAAIHRLPA